MPVALAKKLKYYTTEYQTGGTTTYMELRTSVSKFECLLNVLSNNVIASSFIIGVGSSFNTLVVKRITANSSSNFKFYYKMVDGVFSILVEIRSTYSPVTILPLIGNIQSRTITTTAPSDLAEYTECAILS